MDVCLFRAYENDRPAKIEHFLKWSEHGAAENELVFVSGHPGNTSRLFTYAELADSRDRRLPKVLGWLKSNEVLLTSYSARSAENARRARDLLFGYQNSRKAYDGELAGLLDPAVFEKKRAEEDRLKKLAAERPELKDCRSAWDDIAEAQRVIVQTAPRYDLLERRASFCTLVEIARTLYRAAAEKPKPGGDRLREFRESNRASLELELFSDEPIYADFEELKLASYLTYLAEELGATDPLVKELLAGEKPSRARGSAHQGHESPRSVPPQRTLRRECRGARTASEPRSAHRLCPASRRAGARGSKNYRGAK